VSEGSYPRRMADPATDGSTPTRARRREQATAETRATILAATRTCLLQDGYANVSTRRVADLADVPLSQIHYHFGSHRQLILAMFQAENDRLLSRQRAMYERPEPLWKQWQRAVDYLDEDLASGYVRILNELIAAGWSDPVLAAAVREQLGAWFRLLADVARERSAAIGQLGSFTPEEVAALMGLPFLGAEAAILLGFDEAELPARSALRKVGALLRALEEGTA
jgi:AcrR family transcriptional regulator